MLQVIFDILYVAKVTCVFLLIRFARGYFTNNKKREIITEN